MSDLFLCRQEMAATPFYMESVGINFYSLEEICFFLKKNMDLIDESFMTDEFLVWLRTQLFEEELANLLEEKMKGKDPVEYVRLILETTGLYSHQENTRIVEVMQQYCSKDVTERRKLRADHLAKTGRLYAAVREYEKLIDTAERTMTLTEYRGALYSNLGACYARLFQYEKAQTCFEQAYLLTKDARCKVFAERAGAMNEGRMPDDSQARQILAACEKNRVSEQPQEMRTEELKAEFLRLTGTTGKGM